MDLLPEVPRNAPSNRVEISLPGLRMDSRYQAKEGKLAVTPTNSRVAKMEEALQSAAFLVAGLADGAGILSDELNDAVRILAGELDALGLLEQYRGQRSRFTV
jgi:hypothetical protein